MTTLQGSLQPRIRETLSRVTGHQLADLTPDLFLETDLGIDSIKMVELTQMLLTLIPAVRRDEFLCEVPTERLIQVQTLAELEGLLHGWGEVPQAATPDVPAPTPPASLLGGMAAVEVACAAQPAAAAPSQSTADLAQRLFAMIVAITGHRSADLDLDQYLESDLGIDSIKMVELAQSLLQLVPAAQQERFLSEVPMEQLMQIQTLRELHGVFLPWQAAHSNVVASTAPAPVNPAPERPGTPALAPVELELLHAQIPFLVSHWAVSTCSLCSHVRVQGAFDLEAARAAWTALLTRHPALRACFEIPPQAAFFKDYRLLTREGVQAPQLQLTDVSHLQRVQQDEAVAAEVERCVNHQWPLEAWPLHRFFVFRLGPDLHEVFFTNHHLVSDGLGNQQVVREFLALYAAQVSGCPAPLPAPTSVAQYREVVAALNGWSNTAEEKAAAEFARLQGKTGFFWNPTGAARPTQRAHCRNHRFRLDAASTRALLQLTGELRVSINTLLTGAFLRTITSFGPVPDTLFVNIPTSGRVYPGADAAGVVGCFAQNLTVGFGAPRADESWEHLLRRMHREVDSCIAAGQDRAQNRQTALFARDKLRLENGRIAAAQTGLIRAGMKSNLYLPYIGNVHLAESYGALRVLDYQAATVTNAGTLDTVIELFHGHLEMTTNYDANTYNAAFVARVADGFLACLRELTAYRPMSLALPPAAATSAMATPLAAQLQRVAAEVTHQSVSEADLGKDLEADLGLDSLERIRIVARLQQQLPTLDRAALLRCRSLAEMLAQLAPSAAASAAPATTAVVQTRALPYLQIVEQCRRTPEALAVLAAEGSLSYGDLHRQSNQLAHCLRAQGVGRGTLVGVMLNRGVHFMVGMLAVLKAGGAYVPLDPDYPTARLAYVLKHARIENLIAEQAVQEPLARCLSETLPLRNVIYMDAATDAAASSYHTIDRTAWSNGPVQELSVLSGPDDPMVVLYTSGSTGNPKGVVLAHRGYANRLDWHQQLFQLRAGERVAQKTSICFDISVWELLWPLQLGGVVCPVSTAVLRDPWELAQWVRETRIHVLHFVPSLFGEFLTALESQPAQFPELRHLVFSGEALPVAYVRRWMQRFGNRVGLTNLYGPTEASIDVSAHIVRATPPPDAARIPIGRAMPEVHLRVLDEAMRPVPPGTLGELWIGGLQLAQGYLHDPQRTAESFQRNPFAEIPGPTLYRTGDLAVQLPDGEFDYRGRLDSQIKIRGYRVELGEIEAVLGSHPAVREAAVLAMDCGDHNLRLIACLAGQPVPARVLRDHLATRLPHYMIPHRFDWLATLPRNQNGKIDRKELQRTLHTSIPATSPELSYAVPGMEPRPTGLPLAPAQRWLLRFFDPPYDWAGFTRFTYLQPLDLAAFNQALQQLAQRHATLRARFQCSDGGWRQEFPQPVQPVSAEYFEGTALTAAQREAQLGELLLERLEGLQLQSGAPLWAVLVVKEAEDRFQICVLGHHMISDMLSNGILFKDLWRLYGEALGGVPSAAAQPQSASIDEYLTALEKQDTPQARARYTAYWSAQFPLQAPAFTLPFDHQLGPNDEASAASELVELSAADCTDLQQVRTSLGCGLYPLLMVPLYRLLSEWSGQQRVVLSHRTHGRELGDGRGYFDTVGNFAINYPLPLTPAAHNSWQECVRELTRAFDAVPLKGSSYDLIGDSLPPTLYPDHQLTPVRANYLGDRTPPASRLFEFRDGELDRRYAPPHQKRTALLEVFFSGRSGTLQVEFNYSTNCHSAATIKRWAQRYLELVRDLVEQCTQPASATAAQKPVRRQAAASGANGVITNGTTAHNGAASQGAALEGAHHHGSGSNGSTLNGGSVAHIRLNGQTKEPLNGSRPTHLTGGALAGKVAIVTGAGRGIGLCIAHKLAAQGATIALVSRSAAPLEHALQEVQAVAPQSFSVIADVTRQQDVESMLRQVLAQAGGVDILVNNAGANSSALLAEVDPAEWRAVIDINLMGTFLCCRYVLPHMLARRSGKIINMSSVAGVIGYPLFSAYSAAKHGILGLTKALSEEVKQQNIQVNALCPALVDTRMTPQAFRSISMPAEQVAEVVLFLALPASAGITGEAINVFGRQDMYAYGSEKLGTIKTMTRDFRPGVSSCG